MRYKNPEDPPHFTRELRRLWEVEVYDGDREDPNVTTHIETVVAFNAVDALRRCGPAATMPKEVCFVTWPAHGNDDPTDIYQIDSPKTGRTDKLIQPTVPIVSSADEMMAQSIGTKKRKR